MNEAFINTMRWAQLTFTEDDPIKVDLDFWFDYIDRIHADGIVLSTGGYIAYHQSKVPYQYMSKYLNGRDLIGEAVERARSRGMGIIVRTDPHAMHQDAFEAHPEWAMVLADGTPRPHWSMPGVWVTCALGPFNFDFMTEVNCEIVREYGVDGLFGNRWSGSGFCYCDNCRENFRNFSSMELPAVHSMTEPAYREYRIWREQRLFELWQLWDDAARAIKPDSHYIPNSGGGTLSDLNMKMTAERAEILFADRQSRSGTMMPWSAGMNAKEFRATMGDKPVGAIFSVGIEEPHRWKDSVQSDAEMRIWVANSIASGMRPWFTKFCGQIFDDRWLPVVESIYRFHQKLDPYIRDQQSLAQVGLVYSQQTARWYGGDTPRETVEHHLLGLYHALVEARIPFDMVHTEDLSRIERYKTLILPNIAVLSQEQCDQLRQFVVNGGSLVATHHTSLYDIDGTQRDTFGLSDLFGVDYANETIGPVKNSYINLEGIAADGDRHELLHGMDRVKRIINGVYQVQVTPNLTFDDVPLTLVPAYPDLPMEEVYPREPHTDIPQVYLREVGDGRIVFFPWDIDRTFWEVMSLDHGLLLRNAIKWATNSPSVAEVEGPGVIDVNVWRHPNAITVHMVNLTNPMMMKGPMRELMSPGEQKVHIQLPTDSQLREVKLLKLDMIPVYERNGNVLTVTVPSILDHEVIALDFA